MTHSHPEFLECLLWGHRLTTGKFSPSVEWRHLLRIDYCLRRPVWDHSKPEAPVPMKSRAYEIMECRTWREPEKSPKLSPCLLANIYVISKAHVPLTGARPGPGLGPPCPSTQSGVSEGRA